MPARSRADSRDFDRFSAPPVRGSRFSVWPFGGGKDLVCGDEVSRALRGPACALTLTPSLGAWLSLVERSVRDREVAGSNPVAPTKDQKSRVQHAGALRRCTPGVHPERASRWIA